MEYLKYLFHLASFFTVHSSRRNTHHYRKDRISGNAYLPIVQTTHGIIQGQTVTSKDGRYSHEYLGIPFATPPLGEKRFKKTEPYTENWSGVLDARMFGPSCMQPRLPRSGRRTIDIWNPDNEFNENCLTLNIWTPYPRQLSSPVMVWIHGDSFIKGSSSLSIHNGRTLASHGDVIVVTFNYRLGALGFLATGDGRIEGNMGLYDQRMALLWVKNNIKSFGGNPSAVTLFGESSGAASVGLHLLNFSSENQNLFHRVILQSGSPLAYWATMTKAEAQERLKRFLEKVNCKDDNDLLPCLAQIPGDVIVRVQQELSSLQYGHITWVPLVDHVFIGDDPRRLIKSFRTKHIDVLLGTNKNEGSRWMAYLLNFLNYKEPFKLQQKEFISLIDQVFYELSDTARGKVKDFYLKLEHKTFAMYNRDLYQIVLEDRHMFCPMLEVAKGFSDSGNDVYMYRLKHRTHREEWPKWMGVVHGTDLQYVFGAPVEEPHVFSESEKRLSLRMMKYWTNFAKYGSPTKGKRASLPSWPKFRNTTEKFVKFKTTQGLEVGQHFRSKNCELWRHIETERLEKSLHKKSSIYQLPVGNDTFEKGNSLYFNVF